MGIAQLREQLLVIVLQKGHIHFPEPVALASGHLSRDFIDGKAALANGPDLGTACQAMIELAKEHEMVFDVVGGLTMGADQFAHGIAILAKREWFVVRKAPKGRGTNKRVEGAKIEGARALLVDDVVTTGGSIQDAYHAIRREGAIVCGALTLVDRGDVAKDFFERRGVPYHPVLTYRDLGIEPVGGELARA